MTQKIELTEKQLQTLFKCIGSRKKNLTELHKSNLKHGRTNIAETTVAD